MGTFFEVRFLFCELFPLLLNKKWEFKWEFKWELKCELKCELKWELKVGISDK